MDEEGTGMANYTAVIINTGYAHYDIEKKLLGAIDVEVRLVAQDCISEEQVIFAAKEADAIFVREAPVTRKVIEAFTRCRVIARYGVGIDNVDLETARQRRIYVTNVPEYCTEEVSDHAVALLLACCRKLTLRDQRVRNGIFESNIDDAIHRSTGRTLGLIGYGKIGRAVHRKWKGFLPSRVLVFDPYAPQAVITENGAQKADLRTLLQQSDFISIHAPLTGQTRHLISAETIEFMKPDAILVNTSRGGIIEEPALVDALRNGRILAAGLDVFEREPVGADNPLTELPNAVLSSHVAWYSKESTVTLQTTAAEEIVRVLSGRRPINWVNPWK
jgi:D-3-phosphoglycerate dehydrogenase